MSQNNTVCDFVMILYGFIIMLRVSPINHVVSPLCVIMLCDFIIMLYGFVNMFKGPTIEACIWYFGIRDIGLFVRDTGIFVCFFILGYGILRNFGIWDIGIYFGIRVKLILGYWIFWMVYFGICDIAYPLTKPHYNIMRLHHYIRITRPYNKYSLKLRNFQFLRLKKYHNI